MPSSPARPSVEEILENPSLHDHFMHSWGSHPRGDFNTITFLLEILCCGQNFSVDIEYSTEGVAWLTTVWQNV